MSKLPVMVTAGGAEYPINTDFRAGMSFEELLFDTDTPPWDMILALYYPKGIPSDLEAALEAIIWFYRCGKDEKCNSGVKASARAYDLNHDFDYIYAAFLNQYGIDLYEIDFLHWWKFNALFNGLKSDCEICKIMGYRTMSLNGLNKSDKEMYGKLKRAHALPTKTSEQKLKESKIGEILMNGGDLSGAIARGELEL